MTGMLTGDRMVRLEVSGICQPTTRASNYAITVPYTSMSQTMRNIMRMGGKVTGVQVSDVTAVSGVTIAAPAPTIAASSKEKGKKKK
jgi:hypothetical protein